MTTKVPKGIFFFQAEEKIYGFQKDIYIFSLWIFLIEKRRKTMENLFKNIFHFMVGLGHGAGQLVKAVGKGISDIAKEGETFLMEYERKKKEKEKQQQQEQKQTKEKEVENDG